MPYFQMFLKPLQAAEDNKYRDRAAARRDMKDEYEARRSFGETWGCVGFKPFVWIHPCLLNFGVVFIARTVTYT